ncbi:MAG: Ubiquinone/menaquinone biosynthesis C-methyltransferase UbiE [Myxococcota bacterium]|nr:Ubiquinone/menaquinone biosynthesis C-methyltransferase UbiE [Myxococcota bacterium]
MTQLPASDPDRSRAYWDRFANGYDRSIRRLLGRPFPHMYELLRTHLAGSRRVLEVAAGTGLATVHLASPGRVVVATDYSAGMLEILQRRVEQEALPGVRVEQRDIFSLGYADASFDAVVAANVLHLLPRVEDALAGLRRVLRPGGMLLAPTFCHRQNWRALAASRIFDLTGFPAQRKLTDATLVELIRTNGFEVRMTQVLDGLIPVTFVAAVKTGV